MALVNFESKQLDGDIQNYQWQTILPNTMITSGSPVEFLINNAGFEFIDLSKTRMYVKCHIVKPDGSKLATTDKVTLSNLALQSIWQQIDIYWQNRLVSSSGLTYPYKAMLDVLLNFGEGAKGTQLQSQLYFKDDAVAIEQNDPEGENNYHILYAAEKIFKNILHGLHLVYNTVKDYHVSFLYLQVAITMMVYGKDGYSQDMERALTWKGHSSAMLCNRSSS
jgi:hypothetical protein